MTMENKAPTSIELFTGAGGLALGVAKAEFKHSAVVEWNHDACESLRANSRVLPLMSGWPIHEQDVRSYDFRPHLGKVDLLAAGAPCQPFSLGGKHLGNQDGRNMFPEVFRAVRESLPPAVIVENVKGLLRTSFRPYFDYILAALSAPELTARDGEDWSEHKRRLDAALARGTGFGQRYHVDYQLLNAADYGVPQRRERVFIVAFRSDLKLKWQKLRPTHDEAALLYAKWVTGEYWRELDVSAPPMPARLAGRVARLSEGPRLFPLTRWQTVGDAIRDLPEPRVDREHPLFHNHVAKGGARTYPGHTGSPFDEPAKTLKAGAHGVPGGENMLRRLDGTVRYFSVREAARLQTFPDEYSFKGAWGEGFRQLGNAVPVDLAYTVASRVRSMLESAGVIGTAQSDTSTPLANVA